METSIQSILTRQSKSRDIYKSLLSDIESGYLPSKFISAIWENYKKRGYSNSNINGRIFEYAIAEVLATAKIKPFYYQAEIAFVPNVKFDLVCYHPSTPVVLSVKTSLRERYKQADLEGIAIKSVYRKAQSVLVTLDRCEASSLNKKIAEGDVGGLDHCFVADDLTFDDFITKLASKSFTSGQKIKPIVGQLCT